MQKYKISKEIMNDMLNTFNYDLKRVEEELKKL